MGRRTLGFWVLLAVCAGLVVNILVVSARRKERRPTGTRVTDLARVAPPVDGEACFSPDEPCDLKLVHFLRSAQHSLDVAIYDVTLDQVVHELLVAARTKQVRILVDRRQAKTEHSLVPTLVKAGANVRFGHQRGIMHNKFTVVDGKRLELGSYNYTDGATQRNHENQLYLDNPQVVARYAHYFDAMWSDAKPATLRSLTGEEDSSGR